MIKRLHKFRQFLGAKVWRLFLLAIFVGFLWFIVESAFAYVLQAFLSAIGLIPKVNLGRVADFYPIHVTGAVGLLIGFGLCRATVVFLRYHTANITAQAFIRNQRSKILRYSLENAATTNTPEAISLFNDRVTESGRVIQNFVSIVNLTTAIALFSGLALWLAPIEFLIGILILAIALSPIRRLNKVVGVASAGIVTESKTVTSSLLVGLRNQFLLKVYGEVEPVVQSGIQSLARYENHFKRYSRVYCLNGSFPHFVGVLAVAVITFVSLNYLDTPSSALLAFFYLFFRIAQSASETSALLNEARVYFESMKTLVSFSERVEQDSVKLKTSTGHTKTESIDSIEAKNLSFRWPSGTTVFSDLNLQASKGELLLIKGGSGAGKSTLIALLCGLLQATEGKVLVNGKLIETIDLGFFRHNLGYVGPESYLIEGTLRENLLFAHLEPSAVSDSEMMAALATARLISEFENSRIDLETRFNEFTQLSTGQKQRLSLARALLRKPKMLILDEATANLDTATERELIDALNFVRKNIIVLAVSHRDSFDNLASTIVKLNDTERSP